MINFSFKEFLSEGRSLPIDSEERNFLLSSLNGLLKNDWTSLLVYSDWLQDKGSPLGEYIQIIREQISNRKAGEPQEDSSRRAKFRRHRELSDVIHDKIIRYVDGWYYSGG